MKLPEFKSEEEEAQFWDTHSFADYIGDLEEVELEVAPEEDTCPKCGNKMDELKVNISVADDMVLHNISQYHCPICTTVKLSDNALKKINKLDLLVKRYGLAGMILQKITIEKTLSK